MNDERLPIAIYYEHPDWFRPLFDELDRRGTPYTRLDAAHHRFELSTEVEPCALLFNRMSASAYLRGHGNAVFYTRNFIAHLERNGVRVVNGSEAFAIETSKALQLSLLASLGLPFPRTRVVNHVSQIKAAAEGLRFPIVVKPNIGGRGAGIVRYDTAAALARAVDDGLVELGIDSTALVQEFAEARGGHIVRIETLGGKFLYAIKVFTTGESFNLCPAEICQIEDNPVALGEMCLVDAPKTGLVVEAYEPPVEAVEAVERIAAAARLDMGGVEYLIDNRTGRMLFYDINALSNFVADAPRVVGFDPHERLVDFLEQEAERCATGIGSRFSAVG